jgi:FkbM family methyltransferase
MLSLAARTAELHPRIWQIGWWAAHRFQFLLPHDPSFYALRHFIRAAPQGLFLDIGANDGISALSFRRFDRSYRIFSLEPNALLEPKLQQIKQSDPHFDYFIAGAGSDRGTATFYIPEYKDVLLHTFSCTAMHQVRQGVRSVFGRFIADRIKIRSVESEIVRIDDLSLSPTIVKIDTEGLEYEVLGGMQKTIARSRPFVMLEAAWGRREEIKRFLETRDYVMRAYDRRSDAFTVDLESASRNWFAIPRESSCLPSNKERFL